ncbi:MAG: hypothetical protein KJO08_11200 [Gammaproteobacteria bacterium]|nr:hypothetical protein [Gammaproteobacteria bacterium]NNJ83533.1 hypothetical protein [Gammaproteobacteria bacterium]
MNENPTTTDLPQEASPQDGQEGLHQALSALEGLLGGTSAENIRRRRSNSSGMAPDYRSLFDDEERERFVLPDSDSEAFQSLVGRLTDEIEIIVQSRVEEALKGVTRDISHQLKTHLNIMLPAFLDDLTNLAFHKDEQE